MTNAQKIHAWRETHEGEQLTVEALLDCLSLSKLRGADLRGADLRGADLRGADLRGADLRGADLRGADLRGANLWGANLRGADLGNAHLGNAHLGGATLRNATLRGADLWGANLRSANLRSANLRDANLRDADLRSADLRSADLWGADLWGANLWAANLRNTDLQGVNLAHADGGVLQISGFYPYQVILIPTPAGWHLKVGCWEGTVDDLRKLADRDEGWPEATGDEIKERRPLLHAIINMCKIHIHNHADTIEYLTDLWASAPRREVRE